MHAGRLGKISRAENVKITGTISEGVFCGRGFFNSYCSPFFPVLWFAKIEIAYERNQIAYFAP
jgi:hypothetical protein